MMQVYPGKRQDLRGLIKLMLLWSAGFLVCSCANVSSGASEVAEDVRTIENCQFDIQLEAAPERVICIGQHTVELMESLGLEDRILGWCFPDNLPYPSFPIISERYPSREVILELSPDFVFTGYLGSFKAKNIGSREFLSQLGINSYVSGTRCLDSIRAITLNDVFTDYLKLGEIFRVEERAQEIVDSLQQIIHSMRSDIPDSSRVSIWVFGGAYSDGAFLSEGGFGLANHLISLSSGQNIFQHIPKQGFELNIEQVLSRNPEVILVKQSHADPGGKASIEYLKNHKSLSELPAVKEHRFITVPSNYLLPGPNCIKALHLLGAEIAKVKHPEHGR